MRELTSDECKAHLEQAANKTLLRGDLDAWARNTDTQLATYQAAS